MSEGDRPISVPSIGPDSPADRHHWSGWPGAYCMKCGAEDPMEIALADNLWEPDLINEELIWVGSQPQFQQLQDMMVCPIKGTLIWNASSKKFDLTPP